MRQLHAASLRRILRLSVFGAKVYALSMNDHSATQERAPLDRIVGSAVKRHRSLNGMTLAELSSRAGVSTAMISKIERGQVSASLTTLGALADAIGVPLVHFFGETAARSDVSFVPSGEGIRVQRMGRESSHIHKMIGRAESRGLGLESYLVTLERPLKGQPVYQHGGVEFLHVVEGRMVYRCGDAQFDMGAGDSLSFECHTAHGPVEILSEKVKFLSVMARLQSIDGPL
jgi:transcriptional regulator with XRE-family HTH domain